MLHEAPRDLLVGRVEPEREVRGQHVRSDLLRLVVRIRHRSRARATLRLPLVRTGGALAQLPLVPEQVLEEVVAPLRRRRGPGELEAAGDRVTGIARAEAVPPADSLVLDVTAFGIGPHVLLGARAVRLAEGVAAGDQRHRLLVVHRHAPEGLADVPGRLDRIRIAVRAFRIDVDQAHLHGAEGARELPISRVPLVPQPFRLEAPVDVGVRLPDVLAAATEAEGLEAHRLQGHVSGEDHQIRPGDLAAVLLLDRPEQTTRLVQVAVVRPAVERREALLAPAATAAAVADPVRARRVPGHANHQRPVVTEVCWPPGLRVGHHRRDVLLQSLVVDALELLRVVELLAHRVGAGGMLVQEIDVQRVRPPVLVRLAAAGNVVKRALGLGCHGGSFFSGRTLRRGLV